LLVRRDRPPSTWLMYEDALYRGIEGLLQRRLSALLAEHIAATPFALDVHRHVPEKLQAVQCYMSQLRGLNTPGRPGYVDLQADLRMPERYWRLAHIQEPKQ
jgi:hypothetical protein